MNESTGRAVVDTIVYILQVFVGINIIKLQVSSKKEDAWAVLGSCRPFNLNESGAAQTIPRHWSAIIAFRCS